MTPVGFRSLIMAAAATSLLLSLIVSAAPSPPPSQERPSTAAAAAIALAAATDKNDTNVGNTMGKFPITCHCNMPGCRTNDNNKQVCTSMLGCFSTLQSAVPINEKETFNPKDLDEFSVLVGGHKLNGTYGCLEFLPTKLSCDEILKSMEGDESEFPEIQSPSHETMVKQIKAYHCCSVNLCNDRTRVSRAEKISQASLVAALVKSSEVVYDDVPSQNDSTTTTAVSVKDILKDKSAIASVVGVVDERDTLGHPIFGDTSIDDSDAAIIAVHDSLPNTRLFWTSTVNPSSKTSKLGEDVITAIRATASQSAVSTDKSTGPNDSSSSSTGPGLARKNDGKSSTLRVLTAREVTAGSAAMSEEFVEIPRTAHSAIQPALVLDQTIKITNEEGISNMEKLFRRADKRHNDTKEQPEESVTVPKDSSTLPEVPNENIALKSVKTIIQPLKSSSETIYHIIDNEFGLMKSNLSNDAYQMLAIVGIVSVTLVTLIVLATVQYIRNTTTYISKFHSDLKNFKVGCSNPGEPCACNGRKRPFRPYTGAGPARRQDEIYSNSLIHTPFVSRTVEVELSGIPLVHIRR